MGRAGSRPMRCGLYMGRSARLMRRPMCFDGPARTAAHEVWCTVATTTTSTVPMRPPTCFDGPARTVAHEMWCTTATTTTFWVMPRSLSAKKSDVCTMHFWQIASVYNMTWRLAQMSDQSLGTVVGVQATLLAISATQAAWRFCPSSSRGRNRRYNFVK